MSSAAGSSPVNSTRRRLLRCAVPLSAAATISGCGGRSGSEDPPDRDPTRTRDRTTTQSTPDEVERLANQWGFERIVDAVEAGADPTGQTPVDDVFETHLQSESLLYLPQGRYFVSDTIAVDGTERAGIVGNGATIVPEDGNTEQMFVFGWPSPLQRLVVSGIDFDITAEQTGGRPILARANRSILLDTITVTGKADVDEDLLRIDVLDPEGQGVVRGLRMLDGAPPDTKVTGCQVGDNRGDLWFVDCQIDGFPDNGLYADPPEGRVHVIGGRYRNNGIANVRVESNDPSVIRGVHVRCDDASDAGPNMRGIRLRAGSSILVEDCLVELLDVTSSEGAIVFSSELGAATVRNSRIRVDSNGVNAIRIKSAANETVRDGPFNCEHLTIDGTAAYGSAVAAADRRGCLFRGLCIDQGGESRDGFSVVNLEGEIVDTHVDVSGNPFRIRDSSITRRNVTTGRSSSESGPAGDDPCGGSIRGGDGR